MADSPLIALVKLMPKEAVAYLNQRDKLTKSYNWQDVWQEEHAHQFTVSRLANLDILESMRDGILSSVKGDSSRRDWTKNAKELLIQAGWWGKNSLSDPSTGEIVTTTFDPPRLKLIFDTNTRMAYSAGLWQRIERNKKTHPYIRYITRRDERVRLSHKSWDNVTLPVDDAFWNTHYPPNGWRCRCRAMSISQADYNAGMSPNGERLIKTAPVVQYKNWTNKRTRVIERVPAGIDPGFGYNPGKARSTNMLNVTRNKLDGLPAPMRSAVLSPQAVGSIDANFKKAIEDAVGAIPVHVRESVFAAGYQVKIAPMLVDIKPALKNEHPPGYPEGLTWEYADGGRLMPERIIAVGQTCLNSRTGLPFPIDISHSSDVLRHEFGHAVDDIHDISSRSDFVVAYRNDIKSIDISKFPIDIHEHINYVLREGGQGARETFADVFAELHGGGSADLSIAELFPSSTSLIKSILADLGNLK